MQKQNKLNLKIQIFLIFLQINLIKTKEFTELFGKCSAKDEPCFLQMHDEFVQQFYAGIPSIGLPSFDPLRVGRIELFSDGNTENTIKMTMTNVDIYNTAKSKAKVFKGLTSDIQTKDLSHFRFKAIVSDMIIRAHASVKGKFLLFVVKGSTDVEFRNSNVSTTFDLYIKPEKRGQRTYAKVMDLKMKIQFEGLHIKFENSTLFNGDATLNNAFVQLLNDNWRDITSEISPKINAATEKTFAKTMQIIFDAVPMEDFFKET